MVFYASAVLAGDLSRWAKVLPKVIVPGNTLGNMSLSIHLALAAFITFAGPLQVIPQIRARLVIIVCAILAWRYATHRNFAAHRPWALRLFLVVSGVGFFRVGLLFWILVTRGPFGFDPKTSLGPFLAPPRTASGDAILKKPNFPSELSLV